MAKAGTQSNGNGMVRPPEGMARVGSVANAPWFNLAKGNVLYGELENMYERPDERSKSGKSKFFQIKLLESCQVRSGRGKEAKVGQAEAGTVVNLNYGPKTKELENFVPEILRGAKYTVWAHVEGEKFDIGEGQTMWPVDVHAKMVRPAMASEDPDFNDGDESAAE